MAIKGTSGSASISTTATVARPTTAYSWHFWGKADEDASQLGSGSKSLFGAVPSGINASNFEIGFSWSHSTSTRWKAAFHRNSGNAIIAAQLTTTPLMGTFYSIGGSWDGSNLRVYLNGVNEATTAVATIKSTSDPLVYGLQAGNATGNFNGGYVAEMAFWKDVALTQDEFTALSKKFSPDKIRPASLLTYWSLVRNIQAIVGPGLSSSNASASEHPPIIYLGSRQRSNKGALPAISGTSALALDEMTLASSGTTSMVGAAALTLDQMTLASTGTMNTVSGSGDLIAPAMTLDGAGTFQTPFLGTANLLMEEMTLLGIGSIIGGTSQLVMEEMTLAAVGNFSLTPGFRADFSLSSSFLGKSPSHIAAGRARDRFDVPSDL